MKEFFKKAIKESIYFLVTLIIFVLLILLLSNTILKGFDFNLIKYLILIAHFTVMYVVTALFIYLLNREIKLDKKERNRIYILVIGLLIFSFYVFGNIINIINPIKHILDVFLETIVFKTIPYMSYIYLIVILALIYLVFKVKNLVIKYLDKKQDNNKNKEKDKKDKKTKKDNKEEKKIKVCGKNCKCFKYLILIIVFLIFALGIVFKIMRLNSVYIVNIDEDQTILNEIKDGFKGMVYTRKADLSKYDSNTKNRKMIKTLLYNESQVYIVIPEGYKKGLELSRTNNSSSKEKIIFISLKNEDRNIEYQVLLNRIRENAIVYEIYGDFTETKDILNKFNTEYEINIK